MYSQGPESNPLLLKSLDFGVRIARLSRYIKRVIRDFDLSSQLLRAGTSIGANIAEAQGAQSRSDFIAKLHVSLKECYEIYFWLHLLKLLGDITEKEFNSLYRDAEELGRLLNSALTTAKYRNVKGGKRTNNPD